MKFLITILILILSHSAFASTIADYNIQGGKLHSGGKAKVEILENSPTKFLAKLSYQLYKKIMVPIPAEHLEGELVIELPVEFRDEIGYMELETKGTIDIKNAKLQFVRRVKWIKGDDAYQILILPKNGKSRIEVLYHPTIAAAGWAKLFVTFINKLPVLNGYQVVLDIK